MRSNFEVEQELNKAISGVLKTLGIQPDGYQTEVHLHRGGRKKRRDADFQDNWDPETDSIRISLAPMEEESDCLQGNGDASLKPALSTPSEDRLADLVRALDRAEGRPGYEFISLKWFRDTALAQEKLSWVSDELARHEALREAIDRRAILTSKIANPRPPNFPVTAIRLNRQASEVAAALGEGPANPLAFRPVAIRGESLSATVLRDRR